MARIAIDPVTRIEGHLKVGVETDAEGEVISAEVTGNMFRDFENILKGRHPWDAVRLTQRICGVCPVSHAIASTKAIERSQGFTPSDQAILLRALIQGANYLQDHILHFYHLSLMDYVRGPAQGPWQRAYSQDMRFSAEQTSALVQHFVEALRVRAEGNEMGAILAGRVPHIASIHPGGVTKTPTRDDLAKFRSHLDIITTFIENSYLRDAELLAATYDDYFSIGQGDGSFLSFGAFDLPKGGFLFGQGVRCGSAGSVLPFDAARIAEHVSHSRYEAAAPTNPANAETRPDIDRPGTYTWLKAPRYAGGVHEVGPLARMTISGHYKGGVSVMDRILARANEALLIARAMQGWLSHVAPGVRGFSEIEPAATGAGVGLTEAPRGSLAHWVRYSNKSATRYQIVTPTCWNGSPKDDRGVGGALEQALLGTVVADSTQPVELLRIVHSFDPCLGCAVHVTELGQVRSDAVGIPVRNGW